MERDLIKHLPSKSTLPSCSFTAKQCRQVRIQFNWFLIALVRLHYNNSLVKRLFKSFYPVKNRYSGFEPTTSRTRVRFPQSLDHEKDIFLLLKRLVLVLIIKCCCLNLGKLLSTIFSEYLYLELFAWMFFMNNG